MVVVGVDVSKAKLAVAMQGRSARHPYERELDNDPKGIMRLLEWAQQRGACQAADLTVVMEATGVYHELAAQLLHDARCRVIIANPQRVREYAKGTGRLNKTDRVDARVLLRYGHEQAQELISWEPPAAEIRALRALYARLEAVKEDLQREENRRQQAQISLQPSIVLSSLERSVRQLRQELKRLEQAIEDHFDDHPHLKKQRELLQSIGGVGTVVGDYLLSFMLRHRFRNARQAAAFSGLTPIAEESGTMRAPARMSKHGDSTLRAKLYMAAMSALEHNPALRAIYDRLRRAGKSGRTALVALMRHIVHIAYGVLKHQTPFNPALVTQVT